MSGLIGISNLSTNLPTIYIDKVYIKSDVPGQLNSELLRDGLTLELSLYVDSEDGTEQTDYISHLSSLYGYAALIFDETIMNNIKSKTEYTYQNMKKYSGWFYPGYGSIDLNDAIFVGTTNVETEEVDIMDSMDTSSLEVSENNVLTHTLQEGTIITTTTRQGVYLRQNYVMFNLSDFFEVDESGIMYAELIDDSDGDGFGYVYRYKAEVSIPLEIVNDALTFNELYQLLNNEADATDFSKLHVCAFTSTLDFDSEAEAASPVITNADYGNLFFSNITYELVFDNNGSVATGPYVSWITSMGHIYDGVGMHMLTGEYRAASNTMRISTNASLQNFITQTKESATDDEIIEGLLSLQQILAEETFEPTLLTSINLFALAYPDKSATTPSGVFFGSVDNILQNEFTKYQNQQRLQKQLIFNPKLIDSRAVETDEESYSFPEPEPETSDASTGEIANNRIYDNARITRYAYNQSLAGGQDSETWESSDTLFTSGYIFLDVEKIIRNDTALAGILDIDKLESFYGQEITSKAIKIDSHYLTRYYDEDAQFYILTRYAYDDNSGIVAESPMEIAPLSTVSTMHSGTPVYYQVDVGVDGTPDYTYCLLRNFETATDTRSDYRIACFQFQDYYDILLADESAAIDESLEYYSFYVTCEDNSLEVLNAIRDNFQEEMLKFEEYYNLANEFCSYNNVKEYFNQFFINGINDYYNNDSTAYPFNRMTLIYNAHQEILYNFFDGDMDRLVEESISLSKQLSPEYGTMEQIESFYNTILNLWSSFWDSDGIVGQYITEAESGTFELAYYNEFKNLPGIIDIGESYEDYELDLTIASGVSYMMDSWTASASYSEYSYVSDVEEELYDIASRLDGYMIGAGTSAHSVGDVVLQSDDTYGLVGSGLTRDWEELYDFFENTYFVLLKANEDAGQLAYDSALADRQEVEYSAIYDDIKQFAMLAWPNSTERESGKIAVKDLINEPPTSADTKGYLRE